MIFASSKNKGRENRKPEWLSALLGCETLKGLCCLFSPSFFPYGNNIAYCKDKLPCVQYIYYLVRSWVRGVVLLNTKKKAKNEIVTFDRCI